MFDNEMARHQLQFKWIESTRMHLSTGESNIGAPGGGIYHEICHLDAQTLYGVNFNRAVCIAMI